MRRDAPAAGAAPRPDRRDAADRAGAGKALDAPPTTEVSTPPAPPSIDPAAIAALEAAAAAASDPTAEPPPAPPGEQPVEPLDPAILETLASAADKPPDDGSGLLLVAGGALAVFLLVAVAWAWYHRSSRYLPA